MQLIKKPFLISVVCLAMFALQGCASLLIEKTEPAALYVLNPLSAAEGIGHASSVESATALYIRRPTVPPGFDTHKIAVIKESRELDYIAGAEWSGELSEVLKTHITQSYENRLPLGMVVDENVRQEADLVLITTVRSFEAQYEDYEATNAPYVDVEMVFSLHDRNTDAVVRQIIVQQSIQSTNNSVRDIVTAFETALAGVVEISLQRLF